MARRDRRANGASPRGPDPRRRLRCAIYTRKSTEEGLDQSFNTLDAQRDACEAFIASQRHEGWMLLPTAYDDGGLSGGSTERPALQRLLGDIREGGVDVVVVYKVDRLTRSLSDFARLSELFDRHGASFVSVTQQFNTSTSMGRLTLNVLLSFAQFERELAGERIRDKIALSKRRGMWMGGLPPLGYDGVDRQLVVNAAEAETVRLIFRRYLETGSIAALKHRLDAEGIVSKRRAFSNGRRVGGMPLSRGALYQILRNRLYRGEIAHRGELHRGNHLPIIDERLWAAVQARLEGQSRRKRGALSTQTGSQPLSGLVFDSEGNRLTPSHAIKRGRRYRYYVSAPLVRGTCASRGIRVPAPDLEALVCSTLAGHLGDPAWVVDALGPGLEPRSVKRLIEAAATLARSVAADERNDPPPTAIAPRELIERIMVSKERLTLTLDWPALVATLATIDQELRDALTPCGESLGIDVSAHTLRCGKQVRMIIGEVTSRSRSPDPALIRLITDAHRWFEDLRCGRTATIAAIAARHRQQVSHVSRTLPLAFLAPDVVEMILDGRQPATLTADRLKARRRPLPLCWTEQRALLLG